MFKVIFRFSVYAFALIGFLYVAFLVYVAYAWNLDGKNGTGGPIFSSEQGETFSERNFSKYVYFNHKVSDPSSDLPEPPLGDAVLYGTIHRDNLPVSGITLDVILNEKYKKKGLVTDAAGRFSISVEPGEWSLNVIMFKSWRNKPEGEFKVITGNEPKLPGVHTTIRWNNKQVYVQTEADVETRLAVLELTDEVIMLAPELDREAQATPDYVIDWHPHPKASSYLLEFHSVLDKAEGTHYVSLLKRLSTETRFPLSSITKKLNNTEESSYAVEVKAYDKNGNFVSESRGWFEYRFALSGHQIQSKREVAGYGNPEARSKLERILKNQARREAAELLVEEGLHSEAEALIALITDSPTSADKEALMGYRFASAGQCDEAKRWFAKAINKEGPSCVPERYRVDCGM